MAFVLSLDANAKTREWIIENPTIHFLIFLGVEYENNKIRTASFKQIFNIIFHVIKRSIGTQNTQLCIQN